MSARFVVVSLVGLLTLSAFAQQSNTDRKPEVAQLLDKRSQLTSDDLNEISLVE